MGWVQLAFAFALILVAIALSAWQRLGLGKSLVIGAVRAVIQLTLIGYVLAWFF